MNKTSFAFLAILVFALAACSGKGQQTVVPDDPQPFVHTTQNDLLANPTPPAPGTFVKHIVVLKPGVSQQVRDSIADSLEKSSSHVYNTVFVGFAADVSQSEILSLNSDSRVAYVEEDTMFYLSSPLLENHPGDDPWGIRDNLAPPVSATPSGDFILNAGPLQTEDWGLLRINAFPSPGLKGAGVTVAIIDTGIDNDHGDLVGAIVAEYDAIDDISGPGTANDMRGHGTHVAGIVAARDNNFATCGVAPLASLAAVQVFGDGGGGASNTILIRAIDWVATNHDVVVPPIKIMNMSLSGTGMSKATYDAIQACNDLGITCVVAAGNDFRDASQQMPANFDNVITVSAMRRVWTGLAYDYRFAMFSNFGNTVEVIAPGQSILSLWHNGSTRFASGTSMASPYAAGMAALYLDENLTDGFVAVRDALIADGEAGTWLGDPDGRYEPLIHTNEVIYSWNTLAVDTTGWTGQSSSLAVVDGNPAISYLYATGNDLMYVRATSTDGSTWGTPLTLDSIGNVGFYTSLEIVNGNPAISYWDSTNGDLKYVRATSADGSTWGAPLVIDTVGYVGLFTSLAVANGNPAISYQDQTNGDLKYVRATNVGGSTWGAPQTIDSTGSVGQYTSLTIVNGNPGISYYDLTNSDLKFVRASNADGSAWGAPQTLDSTGDVGQYTSIADVNGNPAISYSGASNYTLKFIRALNGDGTAWGAPQTLDASSRMGRWTSLAVINGRPAISYHDWTNLKLMYIQATNSSGSAWDTPVSLDTGFGMTSLAEVNGNPAISHYDGNLKFTYFGP